MYIEIRIGKVAGKDLFETALNPGELITRIDFPVPTRAAYRKFPTPASQTSRSSKSTRGCSMHSMNYQSASDRWC